VSYILCRYVVLCCIGHFIPCFSLEFLTAMLQIYPEDCLETCAPIVHQSHMSIRMKQTPGK